MAITKEKLVEALDSACWECMVDPHGAVLEIVNSLEDETVEMVDHPAHYNKEGKKECIEEMLEKFGPAAVYYFCLLSAYKYQYRMGDKPGESKEREQAKIDWYLNKAEELKGQLADYATQICNDILDD